MADLNKFVEQIQGFDVNDIDWDRVGVWPLPARIFLFVVAAAAIVAASYFFKVKDQYQELERVAGLESSLRSDFEEKAFEAANLAAYRQQMVEMEESFEAVIAQLPSSIEVPDLLEDIDSKGVESRLEIESIDPQEPTSTEYYVELPIEIKVNGGYHEFGAFVSGVAGMPRIVTLHNFFIEQQKNNKRDNSNSRLVMQITAKTYKYRTQEDE